MKKVDDIKKNGEGGEYANPGFEAWIKQGLDKFQSSDIWAEGAIKFLTKEGKKALRDIDLNKGPMSFLDWLDKSGIDHLLFSSDLEKNWALKSINTLALNPRFDESFIKEAQKNATGNYLLEESTERVCGCDMDIIMSIGCQCKESIDKECAELFRELNSLDGLKVTEASSGNKKNPFRMFFEMDSTKSGSRILSRCMSGRYSCYKKGEQRSDPIFRIYLGDTEYETCFILEGKPMVDGYQPVKKLVENIKEYKNSAFFK